MKFAIQIILWICFGTVLSLLQSCGAPKDVILFEELKTTADTSSVVRNRSYTPIFKPDDYVKVIITSENPEDAAPYNLQLGLTTMATNNGYYNGIPSNGGYLIDSTGVVQLPILGELKLAGLNRMQAIDTILNRLEGHLENPTVQMQILNFKITVLGDVHAPGTFKIPNERVTILEAIGLAGGLNITANLKEVLVIRSQNNSDETYRVDLTSSDALFSPTYYLDQNDVVYVEPNKARRIDATVWYKMGHLGISISSVIASLIIVAFT